jgi:hypothetical protein
LLQKYKNITYIEVNVKLSKSKTGGTFGTNLKPLQNRNNFESDCAINRQIAVEIKKTQTMFESLWRISDSNRPPLACQASALAK